LSAIREDVSAFLLSYAVGEFPPGQFADMSRYFDGSPIKRRKNGFSASQQGCGVLVKGNYF